ncbi:hypothetical protein BBJ28_00024492 [Nothophytophthora sp. Chile5]|nr:hypothetical protein BBJ28_00024492 [Nothophytophthora sp. Chile5]
MALCALVATFVVTALGETVVEVLFRLGDLCDEMLENEAVSRRLLERLRFIWDELQRVTDEEALRRNRVLAMYGLTLTRFLHFLERHHRRKAIARLAASRKVAEQIQAFHADADELFKLLSITHMTEMARWRQEWEQDRVQQRQMLAEVVANTKGISDELHGPALVEALTMLKFELDYHRANQPPEMVQLMRQTFAKVVRTSNARVPRIPSWFIPRDDVEFQSEAFDMGSYGSVHRGTWGNGTKVVVKCLYMDSERAQQSFLQETDVWFPLAHPHVIKLFGACHVSSPAFFVCEDAVHGNFLDYFAQSSGHSNKRRLWRLFLDAAQGLSYLHSKKVVHGDLKCNNLLVGGDEKAKLCDFGFSFIRSESEGLSAKAQPNTIRWKAPECLLGSSEGGEGSPRFASDVYALGMCLLEAFADEPPYGTLDDDSVMEKIMESQLPERPVEMQEDAAWDLIKRMCAFDWHSRPAIDEVVDELKGFAAKEEREELQPKIRKRSSDVETLCIAVDFTRCSHCTSFPNPTISAFCGNCGGRLAAAAP